MDAAGQLAQLRRAPGEIVLRCGEELAGGRRVALELGADHAELERDGDEPLLRAVVEVALEPPALGVADLDDPRARRGELLVGVGVGQRLGDELGEVAQPLLEALRAAAPRTSSPPPARPTAARRRVTGAATPAR